MHFLVYECLVKVLILLGFLQTGPQASVSSLPRTPPPALPLERGQASPWRGGAVPHQLCTVQLWGQGEEAGPAPAAPELPGGREH